MPAVLKISDDTVLFSLAARRLTNSKSYDQNPGQIKRIENIRRGGTPHQTLIGENC